MLKWPELNQGKNYWGSDLQKVKLKIQGLIFQDANTENKTPPYRLPQDRLADMVNPQISKLDETQKQTWYGLFHHFIKASAGKPSQKFIKETGKLIDSIGADKFKKVAQEWLTGVIGLKEIEITHTETYRGRVYNYSTYTFLHEKNLIFLKGLIWSLSKFHDTNTLGLLASLAERSFKKIPGVGPTAAGVGNACIYTLGHSKGLEGLSHLSRLKLNIKQNNTKKLIEKYLAEASEKHGISTAEIEELSIPDFGLENGTKCYKFDDYSLKLTIIGIGKVVMEWIKPDGKIQKTIPAFVKSSSRLQQTYKKAKEDSARIKKYVTAQRDRIDRSYLYDRSWPYHGFVKSYLAHGLVSFVAKDLIWEFKT